MDADKNREMTQMTKLSGYLVQSAEDRIQTFKL